VNIKRDFEYVVVTSYEKYLESIYGPDVQGQKKAKLTTTMDE
jgi:hypothetical protein